MRDDTDIGGAGGRFPLTHRSVVAEAGSADPKVREQAMAALTSAYWKPVYTYVRLRKGLNNEDAKDLTQAFFAHALEHAIFDRYDSSRAAFRTYVRTCLDAFAANEFKAQGRLKRGGNRSFFPLDFDSAERELAHHASNPHVGSDDLFHQEWVRSLFTLAVASLRETCDRSEKSLQFELFKQYDLDGADGAERPTYQQLAAQHGLECTQVTNYLAWVRREFRTHVLNQLRQMTGSEAEFQDEAEQLLGSTFERMGSMRRVRG